MKKLLILFIYKWYCICICICVYMYLSKASVKSEDLHKWSTVGLNSEFSFS